MHSLYPKKLRKWATELYANGTSCVSIDKYHIALLLVIRGVRQALEKDESRLLCHWLASCTCGLERDFPKRNLSVVWQQLVKRYGCTKTLFLWKDA